MSKRFHAVLSVFLLFSLLLAPLAEARAGGLFQPQAASTDFGDAPDSTNNAGAAMKAYPDTPASFPTAVGLSEPFGPRHANETLRFHLGAAISGEDGADSGFDSDLDGDNNLAPPGVANRDGSDDGLLLPASFKHCAQTTLRYQVNVLTPPDAGMYFNLWVDWDRSGAWDDTGALACGDEVVSEWAVQNQALTPDQTGLLIVETPAFLAYAPDLSSLWLRATLSEQPAPAGDGSAPAAGYQDGETEDYLFQPQRIAYLPAMFDGTAGPDPEPVEGEPEANLDEKIEVVLRWAQLDGVPVSGTVQVPAADLKLMVEEPEPGSSDGIQYDRIELNVIANGALYQGKQLPGPIDTAPPTAPFSATVSLPNLGVPTGVRSPGYIEATLVYTGTDGQPARSVAPYLWFHADEGDPDGVVIYGSLGQQRQASALEYDHNAAMSQRLASLIAPDEVITVTAGIDYYTAEDPLISRPPADFSEDDLIEPMELIGDPIPQEPGEAPMADYSLCLRMSVSTIDSGYGEDYGLDNGNWQARGARVKIRHNGWKVAEGYLNSNGCGGFSSNKSGSISVEFLGKMRIRDNNGHRIDLLHMPADRGDGTFYVSTQKVTISNPSPGVTFFPLITGRDPLAVLAYGMQERVFHSGMHGENVWVKFNGCNNDPNQGSCTGRSWSKRFLWLSPKNNSFKRKFVIMHEYGHALLGEVGNYIDQDCSFGSGSDSFHGMTGLEYSSCAAGEGWGHFIAAITWNDPFQGDHPTGFFRYWSGSGVTYNLENGPDTALCGQQANTNCNSYGMEIDWMRQFWDFYTNPGTRPGWGGMLDMLDRVQWRDGERDTSGRVEAELGSASRNRWHEFGCYNSVTESNCP